MSIKYHLVGSFDVWGVEINLKGPSMFISRQKINFILCIFLKILQTFYFGYCGHTWLHTNKVMLSYCTKLLCLSAGKKTTSSSIFFLEILHRYANLFWVLWGCLATHIQNHTINLWKTLMSICMPKINFITHFFPETLHFKESCSLIGR